MYFECKIRMNNAAFEDNRFELENLLKQIAAQTPAHSRVTNCKDKTPVRDSYGNTVGYWKTEAGDYNHD